MKSRRKASQLDVFDLLYESKFQTNSFEEKAEIRFLFENLVGHFHQTGKKSFKLRLDDKHLPYYEKPYSSLYALPLKEKEETVFQILDSVAKYNNRVLVHLTKLLLFLQELWSSDYDFLTLGKLEVKV